MTLDFELARQNMVSNQVRTWEVLDARVLDVLAALRREDFVPEGRMLQALELTASDSVLEIGTGSGFISACLARLAGHVTSLDIHADFTASAGAALRAAQCDNVELITTEAVREFAPAQRYDAIAVTGAVATLPRRWLGWLKPGGRLFVVQGRAPAMQATLLRVDAGTSEILFETDLAYLQHAAPIARFVL